MGKAAAVKLEIDGGYNGIEFTSSEDLKTSIVGGVINGKQATLTFNPDFVPRVGSTWRHEAVEVRAKEGHFIGYGLYRDERVGVLSGPADADYHITAGTGCFDRFEGHVMNIAFNNQDLNKTRTISFKGGPGDSCEEEDEEEAAQVVKKEEGSSMKVAKWIIDKLL
jgi:hypothetical protein